MGAAVFDLSDSAAPQKQVSSPVIEYIGSGLGRGRLCKIFREIIRQSSLVSSTEYCPMVMVMATYRALVAMPHRKFKAPQSVSVIICIELNLLRNTFSLTVKESERMIGRSDRPTSTTSRQGKSIYGESRSFDRRRRPLSNAVSEIQYSVRDLRLKRRRPW